MGKTKTRVFIQFSIGHRPAGKIVFELYQDLTPKTANHFLQCCTGNPSAPLIGKNINKIVDSAFLKGDLPSTTPAPQNESFARRHAHAGVLSMSGNSYLITLSE
jgi:cyclophilin family peptidyl-prolyl cis-trans isomerase